MTSELITTISLLLVLNTVSIAGQETDSLSVKDKNQKTNYVTETFLSSRIINGHSVETIRKKQLELRISHRFGQLNEGMDQFYGLDHGIIHLSLEYGIKDCLETGIGRSTFEKTFDGFVKARIFRQSAGSINMPLQLTYLGSAECITLQSTDIDRFGFFASRLSFINQLMIARKFSDKFSAQLSPTFIHRNTVPTRLDKNDLFSMGSGARYKLTKWIAVSVEYFYVFRTNSGALPTTYYNPFSIGVDIDTGGGHIFQIMLTNSQAMREGGFIGKTTASWKDGGIHLGFNISRLFSLSRD
jgi:hypothetical protein